MPHPKSDLPIGTVSAIYKQAGWKKDQSDAALHRVDP
ncbi:MAG: hypothetical protein ACLPX7_24305 [Xanthobacteraceae bacterium]